MAQRLVNAGTPDDGAASGGPVVAQAMAEPRFEIVPMEGAAEQADHLPEGAKVAVTCSPTKGVDATLRLAESLRDRGLCPVPHVAARMVSGEAHLREILRRLDEMEMREVFVPAGDAREPAGPFEGSASLLEAMSGMEHGIREVGITGYPEGHPLISDADLVRALEAKQRFASYIVTQICFDPESILGWVEDIRRRGIGLPVYVGLPGVVDRKKLLRISTRIGIGDSLRFLRKQAGLMGRLFKPGGYKPDALIGALSAYLGDPHYAIRGFHINTFNQVESTEKWRKRMLEELRDGPPGQPRV